LQPDHYRSLFETSFILMLRPALTATLAIASLAVLPSAITAQSAGDLSKVSAHLKAVTTMTANFTQTDRAGKTLGGVLTIARPGRIRFQYEKGVPILLVSDGRALTFIDYSVKQVQRWPIGNSPLGVLLNPDRDLAGFAKAVPTGDPRILIIEARDTKHPEFGLITLAFEKRESVPGGLMLIGWVALDSQNNRTSIRLSNQRFNVPVSGEAFKWSDPRPRIKGR
jgi:outer membrane lipoprotein-sorting protein